LELRRIDLKKAFALLFRWQAIHCSMNAASLSILNMATNSCWNIARARDK
jgi:hypothetical protein